jgi:HAE1 family hydrophobic/amphiphilic exporter-1
MRAIIVYAVRHRVTMLMVTLAAVLFGVVSLGRLPVQLLPDISYPSLTVQTEYPDSSPHEVETLLSRPLEEAVGVVPGLRRIVSTSKPGLSEITLEFGWDTDMDFAALDVREKIDLVTLPDEARSPVLLRYDPTLDPVVRLGVSGGDNQILLRYLAEQVVKKELESMGGVAAAKVVGGLTEEVHVDVDEQRLAALGVPIDTVVQTLGAENVNAAGGRLRDRESQFLVRTLNQFEGPDDIAETVVFRGPEREVKLKEVASVTRAYREREIVTRIDGRPAVEVAIYKEGDANLVDVAARVRGRLSGLEEVLPEGTRLEVLSDQSRFIQSAVRQVQSNALVGGLLAVLVLLVFLRDVRSTAIIALAIPASIVTTFVLMYEQGVTVNVMSLGGLALGVGMLVDNSIVVLESIVRHRRRGGTTLTEAVVEGTDEVAQAVTASTLTTIAVFLPILFVEGIARQIFKDQALTVTYALLVSLAVSLTLTPMVAALGGAGSGRRRWFNPFTWSAGGPEEAAAPANREDSGRFLGPVRRGYRGLLEGALAHRWIVVTAAVVLLAGSLAAGRTLGTDLIPHLSQGEFRFSMEFPEGTPIEHTSGVMLAIERDILGIGGVQTVYSNVGVDAREGGSVRSKKENHAELNVHLREGVRGPAEETAIAAIRERIAGYENVGSTLQRPTHFTFRTPVAVEIYGYDLRELAAVSERVAGTMKGVPGIKDVAESLEPGSPEVQIRFDRDKLKAAGVDLQQASSTLRTSILGRVATDYKERDRQIDVLVRSGESREITFADLPTMVVGYRDRLPVRLAAVADVRMDRGPAEILRVAQTRAAVVSADLAGRDLGSVNRDIQAALRDIPLPPGVSVHLGGQNEEMQASLASLKFAVALAVFMVYLVMASQFESLLNPFLILFAVPLALVGVVGALLITATPISVVVMIGGIMLAGIVVNNGIVLVDLIGRLHRRGYAVHDAIVEAGQTRLRPILMTTATTVLALLPMASGRGEGGEIGAPLAVTVIGGLLVSTLLTLVVIPVLYSVTHRDREPA